MCGLVGTASVTNLTAAEKKMFAQLLCIDTLRGPHSTGVIVVDKDDEVSVTKRAVDGWTFVETTWYDKAVKTAVTPVYSPAITDGQPKVRLTTRTRIRLLTGL
jgi:hypothetical protein